MPYSEVVPPEEAHSSAEPSPVAKQTHADASDEASVSNEAVTANAARVRPIWPPFEALGPVFRARVFLSVSFGDLRASWAYCQAAALDLGGAGYLGVGKTHRQFDPCGDCGVRWGRVSRW